MTVQVKRQELISYLKINPNHVTDLFLDGGIYADSFDVKTDTISLTQEVLLWLSTKNIDVDHFISFIENRNKKKLSNLAINSNNNILDNDFELEEYENLTLKEICEEYNGITQFSSYLKARKILMDTEFKNIQIKEKTGELISKHKVVKTCFGIIDIAFKRLLDMPAGIYDRVKSLVETDSSSSRVEAEEAIVNQISKILNGAKKEMSDALEEDLQDV